MVSMILQMSAVTLGHVILTLILRSVLKEKKLSVVMKILIGLIYGSCAILSTHFGIDFNHMMLNVRDLGPLSAGLYFDPVSGIIAGEKDRVSSTNLVRIMNRLGLIIAIFLFKSKFKLTDSYQQEIHDMLRGPEA